MIVRHLPNRDKIRVGEVLLQKGLITSAQLSYALTRQGQTQQKLGEVLIQEKLVTRAQLRQALNEQRWRNWLATSLLGATALMPHMPRVMVAEAVPAQQHTHFLTPTPADIGGAEGIGSVANLPARGQSQDAYRPDLSAPLAKQASVDSPLRGFCHPLNGQGWLSQGIRGTTHRGRMEFAYDLAVSIGTPVYAMRAGKVIAVQDKFPDTGGGRENASRFNYVWVEHSQGYRSIYVHLQQGFREKVSIKAGDQVQAGQLIGYSGNSGWSSGPHLHIEVQQPSARLAFTPSVPFAIAGLCNNQQVASAPR